MRRVLLLLAVTIAGAASAASGQKRVDISASLDPSTPGGVQFHLANLLDDPQWREALDDEFPINLHWTVQLWHKRGLVTEQGQKTTWNVLIRHVTVTELYAVTTFYPNRRTDARMSADSLRTNLDQWFGFPLTPSSPGDWYYTVDLAITTLSQQDLAKMQQRDDPTGSAFGKLLDRFIFARGLSSLLLHKQTESFTVPLRR